MVNTEDEVVIPRDLAHKLKALLMNLEDYWIRQGDEARRDRVKELLSSPLIGAEKQYSKPVTLEDLQELRDLIPD